MQYKSITYQRVIVPKAYESKRLEVTVELDEEDNLVEVVEKLKSVVEDLLVTQEVENDRFFTNTKDLKAIARQQEQANLDEINF